jgi:uncharacterized small protein (DUF1192 family)
MDLQEQQKKLNELEDKLMMAVMDDDDDQVTALNCQIAELTQEIAQTKAALSI